MKQVVYYSDYMKEKQHDKRVGKIKRISMYTLVAVLSMQGTQMYSMASLLELFQKTTNIKVNAFVPKKYTNVEIVEPYGREYVIDDNGEVSVKDHTDQTKQACFTNPIDNVTYEYVRARIVAIVKNVDGNDAEGTVVKYTIDGKGDHWTDVTSEGYYYYKNALAPGGSTTDLFQSVNITSPTKAELETAGQYIELNVIVDTVETDEDGDTIKAAQAWGADAINNNLTN